MGKKLTNQKQVYFMKIIFPQQIIQSLFCWFVFPQLPQAPVYSVNIYLVKSRLFLAGFGFAGNEGLKLRNSLLIFSHHLQVFLLRCTVLFPTLKYSFKST